ncbi:MAG: magnesium/cobalt transporter CorA [Rhizobiaceae bacterium]
MSGSMSGKKKRKSVSIVSRKRAPVGASPGTLIADPSGQPSVLNMIAYDGETFEETAGPTLDEVEAEIGRKRTLWLDVTGVGDAEFIARIGALFRIDNLALEDVINVNQRPKTEPYDGCVYIVTHMYDGENAASKEQFSLFLGNGFVLTFQERPGDCLEPVRKRLRAGSGRMRKSGADYLAYALLDTLFDAYFPMTEKLGDELERLEDLIVAAPDPAQLAELHRVRRELVAIKRSLWPSREVLAALMHDDGGYVGQDTGRFLRDTHDHVMQLVDIVETYRDFVTGLVEFYSSSVANRMNEVMKVLTIISTIFIPLGFLAGIWGMNFTHNSPWNMPELEWAYGYPAALALMAAIALGLLALFRWKRWL